MTDLPLHVFQNDTDCVVARDVDDAWDVWCEATGESRTDHEEDWAWEQLPDDSELSIGFEADDPNPTLYEALQRVPSKGYWAFRCSTSCADWANRAGRGFLCSTEF